MSEIDKKIEALAGYPMDVRNKLNEVSNKVELKLRRFGNGTIDDIGVAAKLSRAIFDIDLRKNNDLKDLSDAQIVEMTLRAEGCLETLTALEEEGYIHARKRSFLDNIAAKFFLK